MVFWSTAWEDLSAFTSGNRRLLLPTSCELWPQKASPCSSADLSSSIASRSDCASSRWGPFSGTEFTCQESHWASSDEITCKQGLRKGLGNTTPAHLHPYAWHFQSFYVKFAHGAPGREPLQVNANILTLNWKRNVLKPWDNRRINVTRAELITFSFGGFWLPRSWEGLFGSTWLTAASGLLVSAFVDGASLDLAFGLESSFTFWYSVLWNGVSVSLLTGWSIVAIRAPDLSKAKLPACSISLVLLEAPPSSCEGNVIWHGNKHLEENLLDCAVESSYSNVKAGTVDGFDTHITLWRNLKHESVTQAKAKFEFEFPQMPT